jgi:hypothetical protein
MNPRCKKWEKSRNIELEVSERSQKKNKIKKRYPNAITRLAFMGYNITRKGWLSVRPEKGGKREKVRNGRNNGQKKKKSEKIDKIKVSIPLQSCVWLLWGTATMAMGTYNTKKSILLPKLTWIKFGQRYLIFLLIDYRIILFLKSFSFYYFLTS